MTVTVKRRRRSDSLILALVLTYLLTYLLNYVDAFFFIVKTKGRSLLHSKIGLLHASLVFCENDNFCPVIHE